jgi:hypothetical protein
LRDPALRALPRAIGRALPLLFSGRLLGRLVLWTAAAFAFWIAVGVFAFHPAADALADAIGSGTAARVVATIVVALTFVVAAIVTALVAVATLAMPSIVRLVADRHFPELERRRGGTWHGSLRNVVVTLAIFVPLWLVSLVLLALPPVYVAASWLLTGWLNQRLFRYDALAEHADRDELARVPREIRGRLVALGVLFAPLALVPVVNLAMPLFAAIAFACLCLDTLARRRTAIAAAAGVGR